MTRKLFWTDEKLVAEAKNYATKSELRAQNAHVYAKIIANKLGDKAFAHMPTRSSKKVVKWTDEALLKEASKYENRESFRLNNQYAFEQTRIRGLFAQLGENMQMSRKEKGYWTDARFIKAARRYKSLKLFREEQRNLYSRIISKGLREAAFAHMEDFGRAAPTKEEVAEVAKQYSTRTEFKNEAPRHYNTAHINKWVDEVCMHMPKLDRSPRGYWTKERVLETAKECGSYEAFAAHKAFFTARKRGWIEEVKEIFEQ